MPICHEAVASCIKAVLHPYWLPCILTGCMQTVMCSSCCGCKLVAVQPQQSSLHSSAYAPCGQLTVLALTKKLFSNRTFPLVPPIMTITRQQNLRCGVTCSCFSLAFQSRLICMLLCPLLAPALGSAAYTSTCLRISASCMQETPPVSP